MDYTNKPRDREPIVEFIAQFHAEHGFAPTFREVGKGVGLTSSSTIHHHLKALADEGRIAYNPEVPRTLRVVR